VKRRKRRRRYPDEQARGRTQEHPVAGQSSFSRSPRWPGDGPVPLSFPHGRLLNAEHATKTRERAIGDRLSTDAVIAFPFGQLFRHRVVPNVCLPETSPLCVLPTSCRWWT